MNIKKQLSVFKRISFVEETHQYLVDGQPTNSPSVTQLLKRYKRPFEQDRIAARVAERTGLTVEQVKKDWQVNNLYARTVGSMLHKYIESTYTNERLEYKGSFDGLGANEKEKIKLVFPTLVNHFISFYNDNQHLECLKSELVLGDIDDTRVCGTLDVLAYNQKTDKFEILDFKTNKKLSNSSEYANLLHPFEDLPECEISEYTVQLNTYKYLIEKSTNLQIDALRIVWINANNSTYQIFELNHIQPQIKEMFLNFKSSSLFQEQ